jgi:hypothetical protein
MRPRIKERVNVQEVVEALEYRRKQYSEAIGQIMLEESVSYSQAKKLLESRLKEKVIFKF